MTNPIQTFNSLKEAYLRYFDSPFDLRFEELVQSRQALLDRDGVLISPRAGRTAAALRGQRTGCPVGRRDGADSSCSERRAGCHGSPQIGLLHPNFGLLVKSSSGPTHTAASSTMIRRRKCSRSGVAARS
jgi:hypothetical protein